MIWVVLALLGSCMVLGGLYLALRGKDDEPDTRLPGLRCDRCERRWPSPVNVGDVLRHLHRGCSPPGRRRV